MEMPINSVFTARLSYEHEGYTDVAFNVLKYQLTAAVVTATGLPLATVPLAENVLPQAAQEIFEIMSEAWEIFASEDVGMTTCTTQKVYPGDRSVPYTYFPPSPVSGQIVSQSLPMQDAVTLVKRTDVGQRWGMGRLFVPGIPELNQNGGVIDSTAVANISGLASVIPSTIVYSVGDNTYTIRPVVSNVPTDEFPHVNFILSCGLSDPIIKTQRRRRPGKGS